MKSEIRVARMAALIWLVCYSSLMQVYAAGLIPLSEEARTYDYESLAWAAVFGLMGGVFRTILSLMSKQVILLDFWRSMARDLTFALVGGGAVYVLVQALASQMPTLFNKELRMLIILLAGASRGRWQDWLAGVASDGAANVRAKFRGGAAVAATASDTGPSSVIPPFIEK